MLVAVARLLPAQTPLRFFTAASELATCSEVYHWTGQDVALVPPAHSGGPTGQNTPARPPNAGFMRATFFTNVYHAVLSMPLAVVGHFASLDIKARLLRARGM